MIGALLAEIHLPLPLHQRLPIDKDTDYGREAGALLGRAVVITAPADLSRGLRQTPQ